MLQGPGHCGKGDRDEGEGEGHTGNGEGVFVSEDKGLAMDRGETDMAHRQKVVYKSKGGKPVLG